MHWINDYINKPWVEGADGPDAFDCDGVFRDVQHKYYDIHLQKVSVNRKSILAVVKALSNDPSLLEWLEIDRPEDGCLVKLFKHSRPDHMGVFVDIDGGGVLHSQQGAGVCFDSVFDLKAMGWKTIKFYRHKSKWQK